MNNYNEREVTEHNHYSDWLNAGIEHHQALYETAMAKFGQRLAQYDRILAALRMQSRGQVTEWITGLEQ